jgi:hypothetical protein
MKNEVKKDYEALDRKHKRRFIAGGVLAIVLAIIGTIVSRVPNLF